MKIRFYAGSLVTILCLSGLPQTAIAEAEYTRDREDDSPRASEYPLAGGAARGGESCEGDFEMSIAQSGNSLALVFDTTQPATSRTSQLNVTVTHSEDKSIAYQSSFPFSASTSQQLEIDLPSASYRVSARIACSDRIPGRVADRETAYVTVFSESSVAHR